MASEPCSAMGSRGLGWRPNAALAGPRMLKTRCSAIIFQKHAPGMVNFQRCIDCRQTDKDKEGNRLRIQNCRPRSTTIRSEEWFDCMRWTQSVKRKKKWLTNEHARLKPTFEMARWVVSVEYWTFELLKEVPVLAPLSMTLRSMVPNWMVGSVAIIRPRKRGFWRVRDM